jgi:ketosteroid isomerase-like protein
VDAMTDTLHLPQIVSQYLAAQRDHDADTAVGTFADDATVVDEGHAYRGPVEIRAWIDRTAGEYTYTTELTGTRRIDADHWIATHHLEGNFPGGVVDLHFDFVLRDGKIHHLVIAP